MSQALLSRTFIRWRRDTRRSSRSEPMHWRRQSCTLRRRNRWDSFPEPLSGRFRETHRVCSSRGQ